MSDTPRTDSARHNENDPYMAIASECSKLERELNEANDRIKRLEEAGNGLMWYFCPKNTGDISFLQSEAIRQWNKAKEAKLSVNPIQSLGENLMKAGIGFTTEDKP